MDVKGGLSHVLDQIEREKGIKKSEILKMIEQALASAYRKHAGEGIQVEAHVEASGEIRAYVVKTIVETVTDESIQVSLKEAQGFDDSAGGPASSPRIHDRRQSARPRNSARSCGNRGSPCRKP